MREDRFVISQRFVNSMTIYRSRTLKKIIENDPTELYQPIFVYEMNLVNHEIISIFVTISLQDIEKIKNNGK